MLRFFSQSFSRVFSRRESRNDKPETPIHRLAHEIGRAGRTWIAFWSLGGVVHPDLTRDWMRRCPYDWSATVDIAARIPNECWPIAPSLN